MRNADDLKINLVHSLNCEISIPEVELEFQGGPTAGIYCTIHTVISGIHADMKNNPCLSSVRGGAEAMEEFLGKIENLMTKFPWTFVLDDPDSNSFVDGSGDITIEEYDKDENGRRVKERVESTLSEEQKMSVLEGNVSVEGIAKKIARGDIKNIIMLTGAGISTNAGIPDWRGGKGIYTNTDPDQHTIEMYRKDPEPVLSTWKLFLPVREGKISPTKAHHLIRILNDKHVLLKYYTQNIDCLEEKARIPSEKIVRAHGSMNEAVCLDCGAQYTEDVMGTVFWSVLEKNQIPKCTQCGTNTALKPKIVFFGEKLPENYVNSVNEDFQNCDLLIVLGTSLKVHPFAGLVDAVKETVPRLLINRECVGPFRYGVKHDGNGTISDSGLPGTYRDVSFIGDIDSGVDFLLSYLGWERL